MKKIIFGLILFSLFGCAAPKASVRPDTADITGSRWMIVYDSPMGEHREYEMLFLEQGLLDNRHPNDKTKQNDFWSIDGYTITLHINDDYVIYTGTLINPDRMEGTAVNTLDKTWKWYATRLGQDRIK